MKFLSFIGLGNENKRTWFIYTIVFSMLPVIARFLGALGQPIDIFDFKDIIYGGIAICISNFALGIGRQFQHRESLIGFSLLTIMVLGFCIMVMLCAEKSPTSYSWGLNIIGSVFVFISVWLNYSVNKFLFLEAW